VAWARVRGKQRALADLHAYVRQDLSNLAAVLRKGITPLLSRDGDANADALRTQPEEIVRRWLNEAGGKVDALLRAFLNSRDPNA
jgi:hypothetical protein